MLFCFCCGTCFGILFELYVNDCMVFCLYMGYYGGLLNMLWMDVRSVFVKTNSALELLQLLTNIVVLYNPFIVYLLYMMQCRKVGNGR